ncbi:hypothetical protein JTB14_024079 [Gonioctena quinquepunctata]|nr:hypothetical protein JTB14_024079 [Gonioctena quinquepunctata]
METVETVIKVHGKGGSKMVNWLSNDEEILKNIPAEYTSPKKSLNLDSNKLERVIGLFWDTQEDNLSFNNKFERICPNLLDGKKKPSKREILQLVMTVFDPIGFLSPLISTETNRLKSFEAHRIQEIVYSTEIKEWRWVPSSMNPADLGTEENYDFNFSMDTFWMKGPPFLKQQDIHGPQEMKFKIDNEQVNLIMHSGEWCLPDEHRFSKWSRLLRATGWIPRFVSNMKDKDRMTGELQPEELERAENIWWRKIQALHFKEEIGLLEKIEYSRKVSKLFNFSPFIDENGILRMDSRIKYADVPHDCKYPIILPSAEIFWLLDC